MTSKSLTLYGAVTRIPLQSNAFNIKQSVKILRDRLQCRFGNFKSLDYRNHITPGAYNKGDLAIAQAVTQKIRLLAESTNLTFANWGELSNATSNSPILINGSGYIHLTSNYSVTERLRHDLEYLSSSGRSYALHGVGVNMSSTHSDGRIPTIDTESRSILEKLIKGAVTVSVRDTNSQKIVEEIAGRSVTVLADPALFIKQHSRRPQPPSRTSRPNIGITIPFHGPAATTRVRRDLSTYIRFLRSLQEQVDCNFTQTIHFDSEVIIGKTLQDHGIRLTQAVGDVQKLLCAYQEMDFHIGGMLHSCILSASVGTPCIGLAYDIKHQGFFDLLGQPDLCIPAEPFDPQRLGAACDRVLNQASTIREQINTRRDELELGSNRFLAETLHALLS